MPALFCFDPHRRSTPGAPPLRLLSAQKALLPVLCVHGFATAMWTLQVKKLPGYLRFCALGKADLVLLKEKRRRMTAILNKYGITD